MKYKISIDRIAKSEHEDPESIVSEFEVRARSEIGAILKTMKQNKIRLYKKQIYLVHESGIEFTAELDNKLVYGVRQK